MLSRTISLRGSDPSVRLTCMAALASPHMPNKNNRPALLIIPGGGYEMCSPREGEPIARVFFGRGYNCFVLSYSLNAAAKYPAPLVDAVAAIRHMRQSAQAYNIDPGRIGVMGFSAGAHLAGMLGVVWDAPGLPEAPAAALPSARPDALILCYGVLSADEYAHESTIRIAAGSDAPTQQERDGLSVVKRARSDMPPCFIFHTADDGLVPVENALEMAVSLRKHGVSFEMHVLPRGPHGIALANSETSCGVPEYDDAHVARWVSLADEWLNNLYSGRVGTGA